MVDKLTLTTVQ